MKREQKNTLLLAAGLLGALLAGLLVQRLTARDGRCAVVRVNGTVAAVLPLDEERTLTVGEGGRNVIRVSGGEAFVEEANCPDQICVRTGRVSREGEVVACLPHGLILSIESGGTS